MHPTPAMLEAAWELLRVTPPFRGWRLPEAHEIEFHVVADPSKFGDHEWNGGHIIRVSARKVGHLSTLLATLAHEAVHVRQVEQGKPATHGKEFQRMAATICRTHGWDAQEF